MHITVQSSWLPGYITVVQTTLVILTMARLFLDRLHILGKLILEEVGSEIFGGETFQAAE